MNNGQLTVTITIGLMCFILVSTMFIQFNTINKTDIANIKTMRESELRAELAKWNTKYEELSKKYEDTLIKKEEYIKSLEAGEETYELLEKELEEANMLLL